MLEAAVVAHARVQRVLSGMAERRMPEVVCQANRLGQRLVQAQRMGDRAADLGNLEGMRQASPVQVALVIDEDLCLVHQPPKRRRVDDAIAVPPVLAAVRGRRLLDPSATTPGLVGGIRSQPFDHQAALTSSSSRCRS